MEACKSYYEPGATLTVDEQLLGFRGQCPFRMYISSKLTKYGIKIITLCDVSTKYMLNAIPYVGKVHTLAPGASNLGHHYTITLNENF